MCPGRDRVRWPPKYSPMKIITRKMEMRCWWGQRRSPVRACSRCGPVLTTWVSPGGVLGHPADVSGISTSPTGICVLTSLPGDIESPRITDKPVWIRAGPDEISKTDQEKHSSQNHEVRVGKRNRCRQHLSSTYCVPGTFLHAFTYIKAFNTYVNPVMWVVVLSSHFPREASKNSVTCPRSHGVKYPSQDSNVGSAGIYADTY